MTLRRDKFATRTNPKPPLLKKVDFFDYNGKRYRVTSHSRWYCGAVRSYPPNPNLGPLLVREIGAMFEKLHKDIVGINKKYASCF